MELCDAAPNKWYKLQMRTNVTEDTNSFNTYEICITDEESGTRYIKKDLYFGLPSVCWNPTSYNMNGIGEFKYGAVGHTAYAGATAEDSTLTMDYVMARKATSDDDAAFTETTPAVINSSASRREQTPALAKNLFRRIGSFGSTNCSLYSICFLMLYLAFGS